MLVNGLIYRHRWFTMRTGKFSTASQIYHLKCTLGCWYAKHLLCFMIASPAESNSTTQSVWDLDSYSVLKGSLQTSPEIKGFIQVTLSNTLEINLLLGITVRAKCVCLLRRNGAPKSRKITLIFISAHLKISVYFCKHWLFASVYRNPHLSDSI